MELSYKLDTYTYKGLHIFYLAYTFNAYICVIEKCEALFHLLALILHQNLPPFMQNSVVYFVLFALAIFGLSACVPKQQVIDPNPYVIADGQRPWVIAHGGAKDLFPENTMVAFNGSFDLKVDAFEIDLCMTKDEVIVCHHDLTIDAMSDGEGNVIDYTFEELQAFNFGHGFEGLDGSYPYRDRIVALPSLAEVLDAYPNMHYIIELKNQGENGFRAGEVLFDLLENYNMGDRVIVASFRDDVLQHFVEVSRGKYLTSSSEKETEDFTFSGLGGMEYLYRPEAIAVQIPMSSAGINLATERIIRSAHRRRMAVHYWTIDDPEDMELLIGLGADGLITDRPDLMWAKLREMGY